MKNKILELPEYVEFATQRLEASGYEVFAVGGCVRDMLMGKVPNDYDLTTSALPEQIKECFSDQRVIETGIKHGTVTVLVGGVPLEITTYRCDGEYDDNRHPKKVTFTKDIRDDLARRDFTVNAMAYNKKEGLVDPFGGAEDISRSVIRCVGDPDTRFSEDGLRIMRAVRFCSVLGFSMDKTTEFSVKKNRELLKNISAERLRDEFFKLICGKNATDVIREFYGVIAVFIPELLSCVGFDQNCKYHSLDVFEHTLAVIDGCSQEDRILRLAAFFHDIGKPLSYSEDEKGGHFYGHAAKSAEIAERVMLRLRSDNESAKKVRRLVSEHMKSLEITERAVRRFVSEYSAEDGERAVALAIADRRACAEEFSDASQLEEFRRAVAELREKEGSISLRTLAVHGDDIIKLGYKGKAVGECLAHLLSQVLDGEIENKKDALIAQAERFCAENFKISKNKQKTIDNV